MGFQFQKDADEIEPSPAPRTVSRWVAVLYNCCWGAVCPGIQHTIPKLTISFPSQPTPLPQRSAKTMSSIREGGRIIGEFHPSVSNNSHRHSHHLLSADFPEDAGWGPGVFTLPLCVCAFKKSALLFTFWPSPRLFTTFGGAQQLSQHAWRPHIKMS